MLRDWSGGASDEVWLAKAAQIEQAKLDRRSALILRVRCADRADERLGEPEGG